MRVRRFFRRMMIAPVWLIVGLTMTASPGFAQRAPGTDAPPAADETLIYVIREGRMLGGAVGYWIAVNDQTVARVRNDRHAVIRADAGLITLNLAIQGNPIAYFVADDRPGETIYLEFRIEGLSGWSLTEISADEAERLLAKTERQEDLDELRNNNEYDRVLSNPGLLGFDLMAAADAALEPDAETAVITFLRRKEKDSLDIAIWGSSGLVATLKSEESVQVAVPPGEHYFLAGHNGRDLLRATVEAGKRYYAVLDVGRMAANVKFVPVDRSRERDLNKWLDDAAALALNQSAITDRVRERFELVAPFIQGILARGIDGEAQARVIGPEHAF